MSPLSIILWASKNTDQIELLELGPAGIHVTEYLTVLPSRAVLWENCTELWKPLDEDGDCSRCNLRTNCSALENLHRATFAIRCPSLDSMGGLVLSKSIQNRHITKAYRSVDCG